MSRWTKGSELADLGRRLLLLLLLWVCYRYLLRLSLTYFSNSDDAGPLLVAEDILHGNWILRGWWMATDALWFTDLPWYIGGVALKGLTPSLMHEVPTATYLGMIAIVAFAVLAPLPAVGTSRPGTMGIALMAALMPLIFPSDTLGNIALTGPYHIATTGFVLVSFLMMHYALLRDRRQDLFTLAGVATALLAAAIISDPLAVWIGAVPAILTSLGLIYRHPTRPRSTSLLPASVAMTAWLIAKIGLQALRALRGLPLNSGVPDTFVDLPHFGSNVALFVQGLLELFGANFFGLPASAGTLPVLVRFLGCLAALGLVGLAWRRHREGGDSLSLLLSASAFVLAGAYIFSSIPRPFTTRYLIPLVVFGSILLGREVRRVVTITAPKESVAALLVLSVFTGFYAWAPMARLRQPASGLTGKTSTERQEWPALTALGSWMAMHGLREGYGPYWAASIVTVATRGSVIVRPVSARGDGKIRPFDFAYAKCSWYRDPAARFVLAKEGDEHAGLNDNVNLRTVTLTLGPPTAIHTVAGYAVFEWDHPIVPMPATSHATPRRQRIFQRLIRLTPMFQFMQPFFEPASSC